MLADSPDMSIFKKEKVSAKKKKLNMEEKKKFNEFKIEMSKKLKRSLIQKPNLLKKV